MQSVCFPEGSAIHGSSSFGLELMFPSHFWRIQVTITRDMAKRQLIVEQFYTNGVYTRDESNYFSWSNWSTPYVNRGNNKPGFPAMLGLSNLTTSLYGERPRFYPGADINIVQTAVMSNFTRITTLKGRLHLGVFNPANYDGQYDDIIDECGTELLSAIYQIQAGSQSGVLLGEIRQTLRLLRSPFSSSIRVTQQYAIQLRARIRAIVGSLGQNGNVVIGHAKKRQLLKAISQAWLEYNFAMRPLVADMESHANRLGEILRKREKEYAKAKAQRESVAGRGVFNITVNGTTIRSEWRDIVTQSARGAGLVNLRINADRPLDARNWGLRHQDFVPTLYELIPFSFLVDYFTNLNHLVNAAFAELRDCPYTWVTSLRRVERIHQASVISPSTVTFSDVKIRPHHHESVTRLDVRDTVRYLHTYTPNPMQTANIVALLGLLASSTKGIVYEP